MAYWIVGRSGNKARLLGTVVHLQPSQQLDQLCLQILIWDGLVCSFVLRLSHAHCPVSDQEGLGEGYIAVSDSMAYLYTCHCCTSNNNQISTLTVNMLAQQFKFIKPELY